MFGIASILTFVFPVMRESMGMFGLFLFYCCCSLFSGIVGGIIIYEPKSREELNKEDEEGNSFEEERNEASAIQEL